MRPNLATVTATLWVLFAMTYLNQMCIVTTCVAILLRTFVETCTFVVNAFGNCSGECSHLGNTISVFYRLSQDCFFQAAGFVPVLVPSKPNAASEYLKFGRSLTKQYV